MAHEGQFSLILNFWGKCQTLQGLLYRPIENLAYYSNSQGINGKMVTIF